jgi:hypothetical protein
LSSEIRKEHRNEVAHVLVATATDDNTVAFQFAMAMSRRLESNCHFRPERKRCETSEFDAIFRDEDSIGRERKLRLTGLNRDLLETFVAFNFSRAHNGCITLTHSNFGSN